MEYVIPGSNITGCVFSHPHAHRLGVLTLEKKKKKHPRRIRGYSGSRDRDGFYFDHHCTILTEVCLRSKSVCFHMFRSPWNSGSVATRYVETRQASREHPMNASRTWHIIDLDCRPVVSICWRSFCVSVYCRYPGGRGNLNTD